MKQPESNTTRKENLLIEEPLFLSTLLSCNPSNFVRKEKESRRSSWRKRDQGMNWHILGINQWTLGFKVIRPDWLQHDSAGNVPSFDQLLYILPNILSMQMVWFQYGRKSARWTYHIEQIFDDKADTHTQEVLEWQEALRADRRKSGSVESDLSKI
jgi:hypothetical protein